MVFVSFIIGYIITVVRGIPLFYIDESHSYISGAGRAAATMK